MDNDVQELRDFEAVKARLDEIVAAVADEGLALDDALDLYEEAVALGMRANDLVELGIEVPDDPAEAARTAEEAETAAAGGTAAAEGAE